MWWNAWIIIIKIVLMCQISLHNPWYILLGEPWVENVFNTIVIWSKLDGMRLMSTYLMTMNIKSQVSTKLT